MVMMSDCEQIEFVLYRFKIEFIEAFILVDFPAAQQIRGNIEF